MKKTKRNAVQTIRTFKKEPRYDRGTKEKSY